MKISMIGVLPPLTGLSYYCHSLAKCLQNKLEIDFYSFKKIYPGFLKQKKTDESLKKLKLEKINVFPYITYYNPLSWLKTAFSIKTELVHLQLWSLPPLPILIILSMILKLRGKKLILTVHNINYFKFDFIYSFLTKFLLYFVDAVIVHSDLNKEDFIKKFKFKKDVFVIHHGAFDIYNQINKEEARKKLGFKDSDKIILNFGLIKNYKGVDDLIIAFKEVKERIKEAKLIIAGEVWGDSDYYSDLINKSGCKDSIIFIDKYLSIDEVSEYLSACDLVVLPYKKSFNAQSGVGGIVLLFGKPLIVSNAGALNELVKDKNAVFESGDNDMLINKIVQVLSNSLLIKKLSKDSLEISKLYSWDIVADKTIEVYEKLSK